MRQKIWMDISKKVTYKYPKVHEKASNSLVNREMQIETIKDNTIPNQNDF